MGSEELVIGYIPRILMLRQLHHVKVFTIENGKESLAISFVLSLYV